MTGISEAIVQQLRDRALQGASVPELLSFLIEQPGAEVEYTTTLVRYFMVAFALPLRAVSPIGGWSPDSAGEISDQRIHELIYPEMMRTKSLWATTHAAS